MATVLVRAADLGGLRPTTRALTTGGVDTTEVTVRVNTARPSMVLRVDRASAWRFRAYSLALVLQPVLGLALVAASALAYGYWRNWPAALGFAVLGGAVPGLAWLVRPKAYPSSLREQGLVRMRGVDDEAAREWQAANAPGAVTIETAPELARRFAFGRPVMFLAALALSGLAFGGIALIAPTETPAEREVLNWTGGSGEDRTATVTTHDTTTYIITWCTGGGDLSLETADTAFTVACDGRTAARQLDRPSGTNSATLRVSSSASVAGWQVRMTRDLNEEAPAPARSPSWTVAIPIVITVGWGLLVLEAIRPMRFWYSKPPSVRPNGFRYVPELAHITPQTGSLSLFGLFFAGLMTLMVWLMWATTG